MREVSKAKSKAKDGIVALTSEVCAHAVAAMEGGEDLPSDMLVRLIKLTVMIARNDVIQAKEAARALEQAADQKV